MREIETEYRVADAETVLVDVDEDFNSLAVTTKKAQEPAQKV